MSNQDNNQINLLKLIQWLINSVKANIKALIIINAIIAASLVFAKLYIPQTYEGSLLVKSNIIEYHFISEILSPLIQHSKDRQTESIARSLNIPMELANSFGGYEIESLIDEEYVTKRRNTISENLSEYEKDQIFNLRVRSRKKEDLPKLKNALLRYLRSQKYIKERKKFFLERQQDVKKLYEADIQSMSKIKEAFSKNGFDPNAAGNDLIVQGLGDFFFGSMRIYENYVESWYLLEFNDSFEEMSKFEIYDKHVFPRWTPFIIAFVLISIILSFLYIIIVETGKSLKKIES